MNNSPFSFDEFISDNDEKNVVDEHAFENSEAFEEDEEGINNVELDVQKTVVEELAAEKIKLSDDIESLKENLFQKEKELESLKNEYESLKNDFENYKNENSSFKENFNLLQQKFQELEKNLKEKTEELTDLRLKETDTQERNPNSLALLDRDVELPDRFPGETRDHLLEVILKARNEAEEEGRLRKAQILESVLVANEPNGSLMEKRKELEKVFNDNGNIISGIVIEELKNRKISHKHGEEYLLPSEILKINF